MLGQTLLTKLRISVIPSESSVAKGQSRYCLMKCLDAIDKFRQSIIGKHVYNKTEGEYEVLKIE